MKKLVHVFVMLISLLGLRVVGAQTGEGQDVSASTTSTTTTIASLVSMVSVPGGSFQMGTPSGGSANERPVRVVTVSGFMMSQYEVTQDQYRTVTDSSPSKFSGADLPVEQVSWYDAVEFCNKLSELDGLRKVYTITRRNPVIGYPIKSATVNMDMTKNGYRLPTEAEWEYAARGGNESPGSYAYAGSNDIDAVAWYKANSGKTTHKVGTKASNGLGLYDMTGNVWEWCWDTYGDYPSSAQTNPRGASSGRYRVQRGGSWSFDAMDCRSAYRGVDNPGILGYYIGFRIVCRPSSMTTTNPTTTASASTTSTTTASTSTTSTTTTSTSTTSTTTTTTIPPFVSMVRVPGGGFSMGTPSGGEGAERPVHHVTVSSFLMSAYEVTQEQYRAVSGSSPSKFRGTDLPVEQVSWYDAVEFCNKLSEREGLAKVYSITNRIPATGYPIKSAVVTMDMTKNGYRLPTEAEWEYAARGGNGSPGSYTYAGSNDIDAVAWYEAKSGKTTHKIGTRDANGLGLYDMTGNVYEWCWDLLRNYASSVQSDPTGASSGTARLLRGGSWSSGTGSCRSSYRGSGDPGYQAANVGFRLVRRPSDSETTVSGAATPVRASPIN